MSGYNAEDTPVAIEATKSDFCLVSPKSLMERANEGFSTLQYTLQWLMLICIPRPSMGNCLDDDGNDSPRTILSISNKCSHTQEKRKGIYWPCIA